MHVCFGIPSWNENIKNWCKRLANVCNTVHLSFVDINCVEVTPYYLCNNLLWVGPACMPVIFFPWHQVGLTCRPMINFSNSQSMTWGSHLSAQRRNKLEGPKISASSGTLATPPNIPCSLATPPNIPSCLLWAYRCVYHGHEVSDPELTLLWWIVKSKKYIKKVWTFVIHWWVFHVSALSFEHRFCFFQNSMMSLCAHRWNSHQYVLPKNRIFIFLPFFLDFTV